MEKSCAKKWYAARLIGSKAYVEWYLKWQGLELRIPGCFPRLYFVCCDEKSVRQVAFDLYGKMSFYLNPDHDGPQTVDYDQMCNFLLVASLPSDQVIPVQIHNPQFLAGDKVRVTSGPFKGAVGVVRRIKGTKRLVIGVDGIIALATTYIPQSLLEPLP